MKHEDNPKSIKYYMKQFFLREKLRFKGKRILDFPAGSGVTSNILKSIGAIPLPYDLFPEFFKVKNLTCLKADINKGIPLENQSVDAIVSQEGIEHFENQLKALHEFNRVLKVGGSLIITTPNYSNMVGRLSYFLSENELFNKQMPQNELNDIWVTKQETSTDIYYGHLFLIGINKLRLLAKISGFRIKNIENTRVKTSAVILLVLFYPFILLSNWRSYKRCLRRNKKVSMKIKKEVYGEIFKLATTPRLLVNSHIFVEFEKEFSTEDAKCNLTGSQQELNAT
ncbi:class I SAM-dependent methyltransferase [Bathymodiolus thermophilus thioautotrophic gill symbiont]|nr:class I SAM-dependent methyltransferase [Bathymodiolus thermophilus thioautotrophic gill symbiont]